VVCYILPNPGSHRFRHARLLEELEQLASAHDAAVSERAIEGEVFLAVRDVFRNRQIVRLEAKPADPLCIPRRKVDQPPLPTGRQRRRALVHRIGVVAELLMKG
jgi:hypothetical protein